MASTSAERHPLPRYYQSQSMLKAKSDLDDSRGVGASDITAFGTRHFAQCAKYHAYPKGLSLSDTIANRMRDQGFLCPARDNASPMGPSNLSPSLQAAAAKSLPPIVPLADTMPPIADVRPSTAVAGSVPLPGPRDLIESTATEGTVYASATLLTFGSTAKIVPLPVRTTRPLPMLEPNNNAARPAIMLTAKEYSFRSEVEEPNHTSQSHQQSRIPSTFCAWKSSRPKPADNDRTSDFKVTAQCGPDFISAIGNLNIPPGFTSVNPPGRSFVAKKRQELHESNNKPIDIVGEFAVTCNVTGNESLPYCRTRLSSREMSPTFGPVQNTGNEECEQEQEWRRRIPAPMLLADPQSSIVNRGKGPELAKRPRGRPPGIRKKKRKRTNSDAEEDSDLDGGSTGGKAKLFKVAVSVRFEIANSVCLTVHIHFVTR